MPTIELISAAALLVILGLFAGFSAGLLGIGGGAIAVPGLYYILKHFGYSDVAMHVAVGTSLLMIIFNGLSSAYAHYKKGAVDFTLLRQFIPGIFIGVGIGTLIADIFDSNALKIVFASSQILFGGYMMIFGNRIALFSAMPKQPWTAIIAAINACIATLMGVGGGVQNVCFMTICGVQIHRAIATAAAIGPFIAVIGTIGFLIIGWDNPNTPPLSIGYLNIPAFLCLTSVSILTAPLGAKLAHSLPVPKMKRVFAIFMLLIAAKMLSEIIWG